MIPAGEHVDLHPCHVPGCGDVRCIVCHERLLCIGPEPAAYPCATHVGECQSCNDDHRCPECAVERMEARAARIWDHAADNPPPFMTAAEERAGHWGELRAEERAYEDEQLRAREEGF